MLFYLTFIYSLQLFLKSNLSCAFQRLSGKEFSRRGLSQHFSQWTKAQSEYYRDKRAWLPSFSASLTAEAAIVMPLMILVMYLLIFPLRVMESERRIQNRMEAVAKQLTLTEYIRKTGEGLLKPDEEQKEVIHNVLGGIGEAAAMAYVLAAPESVLLKNVRFTEETSILSTDEGADSAMVHMEFKYSPDYPMTFFSFPAQEKTLVAHRRAWVGSSGGRGRDQYGIPLEEEEDEEDRIVYLGKTSVVYHEDPRCHYLSNDLLTADASQMKDLRNAGGSKYHACPSCRPESSGTVWYSANGTAYHSSEHCKAITAYARAVHYHEVEGMRSCSYCGRH